MDTTFSHCDVFSSPSAVLGVSPYGRGRFIHSPRRHATPYHRQDGHLGSPHKYPTFRGEALIACLTTHSRGSALSCHCSKKVSHFRPQREDTWGPAPQMSHSEAAQFHLVLPTSGPMCLPNSPLPRPVPVQASSVMWLFLGCIFSFTTSGATTAQGSVSTQI